MTQGPQEQLTKISMLCMGLDADDFLYYERCVCNDFRWHHQLQKWQEARVHSTHAYTHAHMYTQTDKRTCFASEKLCTYCNIKQDSKSTNSFKMECATERIASDVKQCCSGSYL